MASTFDVAVRAVYTPSQKSGTFSREDRPTVSHQPSPNGSIVGRASGGRFAPGNAGGPGNPFARRVGEIRALLLQMVTDDDLRAIVNTLIDQAKAGDVVAAREVLDRLIGKSVQAIALDAKLGIRSEPEPRLETDMGQLVRAYAELGVPLENWPSMPIESYKQWLADDRHPTRPPDFPALVKTVREKCEVWRRI